MIYYNFKITEFYKVEILEIPKNKLSNFLFFKLSKILIILSSSIVQLDKPIEILLRFKLLIIL